MEKGPSAAAISAAAINNLKIVTFQGHTELKLVYFYFEYHIPLAKPYFKLSCNPSLELMYP